MWAFDQGAQEWRLQEVVAQLRHEYDGDVVSLSAGEEVIEATGNHPFWVVEGERLADRPECEDLSAYDRQMTCRGRWVEARDLRVGDQFISRSGKLARAETLSKRNARLTVYNLEVRELNNYAVGRTGILVHNKSQPFDPFKEAFDSVDDAIGETSAIGSRTLEIRSTTMREIIAQGYTEMHRVRDSAGNIWTVFRNPRTGRFSGGHLSSDQLP